jgi:spermidine/putrescine transport system substrate-binding protein
MRGHPFSTVEPGRAPEGRAIPSARISRRALFRALGVGVGTAAVAPLFSCTRKADVSAGGSTSATVTPSNTVEDPITFWADQQIAGVVDFANWPYYIDRTRTGAHPSLERFTEETGIDARYTRPIRGNARFLDKIRPSLEAGNPAYDLIVITNGPELTELISSGWVAPLNHDLLPNFARYAAELVRGPAWDPDNRYTAAWQSGFTGLGFRPEAVDALGREPKSVKDLWDPKLRDRVGMMTDLLDLGSAGLLATGADPATSTVEDWRRAADHLGEQHERVAARYYDQGYIDALGRGDTWLSLAWSGDVFQLQQLGHPEVRWIMPEEGAMFWTDNMMIPRDAQHPADAITLMDFVYRPEIAALIADWVWYVSPVPAAQDVIARRLHDPVVAKSPLVFPHIGPSGLTSNEPSILDAPIRNYFVFSTPDQYEVWRSLFEPVIYAA